MRQIRVLVVEDSMLFRELLVQALNADPDITVVATASNPFEARDAIVEYRPDVMTLDVELPQMNGIEFLQKLMPQYPLPTVVISSLSDKVFDALNAGAVDFVAKPAVANRAQLEAFIKNELPAKVKIASVAKVSSRRKLQTPVQTGEVTGDLKDRIIAIGASTGGTEAIATVLNEFGTDLPGVVIVQHMPAGFTEMFAKRLNNQCSVTVKEARSGDYVLPGQVLIAPGGPAHMHVIRSPEGYQVVNRTGEKVSGHCPSVDVLFHSVAEAAGKNAIGVLLTGMGADGAKGLLAMKKKGAGTIGQDESTCIVYGMPKVAKDLGAVEYQEKLTDVAKRVYALLART